MANKFGEERGKENLSNVFDDSSDTDKFGRSVEIEEIGILSNHTLRKLHANGMSGIIGSGRQSMLASKHLDAAPPKPKDKFEAAGMPEASLRHVNLGVDFDGDTAVLGGFPRGVTLAQEPVDKFEATRDVTSRGEQLEIKGVSFHRSKPIPDGKFGTKSQRDLIDDILRKSDDITRGKFDP